MKLQDNFKYTPTQETTKFMRNIKNIDENDIVGHKKDVDDPYTQYMKYLKKSEEKAEFEKA